MIPPFRCSLGFGIMKVQSRTLQDYVYAMQINAVDAIRKSEPARCRAAVEGGATGTTKFCASGAGCNVGQPTPSFRAELALDPESRR